MTGSAATQGSGDGTSLPLDSDVEFGARARPVHLRVLFVALVVLGGALGTAARESAALLIPSLAGLPAATFAVNVAGAFVLGLLLEALVRRGADEGRRRAVRLLLGTGFCGGFTTYSTLSTDAVQLGPDLTAVGYALATVLVGAAATWLGIAAGSRLARA